MTTHGRPDAGPEDDENFSDPQQVPWVEDDAEDEEPAANDVDAWLEEPDAGPVDASLDDMFGPWVDEDQVTRGIRWPSLVPARGFYRD